MGICETDRLVVSCRGLLSHALHEIAITAEGIHAIVDQLLAVAIEVLGLLHRIHRQRSHGIKAAHFELFLVC
jgi:hypothetical protein